MTATAKNINRLSGKSLRLTKLACLYICMSIHTIVFSQSYQKRFWELNNYYAQNYDSIMYSANYADTLKQLRTQADSLAFIDYLKEFGSIKLHYGNDIDSIVSLLGTTNDAIVRRANMQKLHFFCNQYPDHFYLIRQKSSDLIPFCSDYQTNTASSDLLSVLDLPDALKDSVLLYLKTDADRATLARLGDTIAENQIITDFESSIQSIGNYHDLFGPFRNSCIEMMKAGTAKCLKTYISYFDWNQIVEYKTSNNDRVFESVLSSMLFYFSSYHPDCFVLSISNVKGHWNLFANRRKKNIIEPTPFEKDLFRQIENYCLSTYNVTLHIDLPFVELIDDRCYIEDMELEEELSKMLKQYNGKP